MPGVIGFTLSCFDLLDSFSGFDNIGIFITDTAEFIRKGFRFSGQFRNLIKLILVFFELGFNTSLGFITAGGYCIFTDSNGVFARSNRAIASSTSIGAKFCAGGFFGFINIDSNVTTIRRIGSIFGFYPPQVTTEK